MGNDQLILVEEQVGHSYSLIESAAIAAKIDDQPVGALDSLLLLERFGKISAVVSLNVENAHIADSRPHHLGEFHSGTGNFIADDVNDVGLVPHPSRPSEILTGVPLGTFQQVCHFRGGKAAQVFHPLEE